MYNRVACILTFCKRRITRGFVLSRFMHNALCRLGQDSFLACKVCFSSDMGQRRWGTLQFLRAFSICVMVMNVRLPSCDSWAITFYQDFCKTPVTVNIDGKMQLGMVINATVANNAKTGIPWG